MILVQYETGICDREPFDLQRSPKVLIIMRNVTFGDLCRSNGGYYDFGVVVTYFNQHVSVCPFSSKSHWGSFPIRVLPISR